MKEAFLKRDWQVVGSRATADFLADPARAKYLRPFLKRDSTLSEAARALRMRPNKLLHHVTRMLKLGLLRVQRTEARGGRPSKVYAPSARRFIVPFSETSAETLEDLLIRTYTRALRSGIAGFIAALKARSSRLGAWLWLSDRGVTEVFAASPTQGAWLSQEQPTDPLFPAALLRCLSLQLSEADARLVQRELFEVLERAAARSVPDASPHQLLIAFAPEVGSENP